MPPVSISPQVEALTNRDSDLPGMRRPIAGRQLLGDQPIGGGVVRNAQQRFGDAHEGDALLIRQPEFLQECIEERPLVAPRARAFDQRHGQGHCAMSCAAGQFQPTQQTVDRPIFLPQAVIADRAERNRSGVGLTEDSFKLAAMAGFLERAILVSITAAANASGARVALYIRAAPGACAQLRSTHACPRRRRPAGASMCSCRTAIRPDRRQAPPSCCAHRGPD